MKTGRVIPNSPRVADRENGEFRAEPHLGSFQRDVKWSDGQPFTAREVEFTIRRYNPKSPALAHCLT